MCRMYWDAAFGAGSQNQRIFIGTNKLKQICGSESLNIVLLLSHGPQSIAVADEEVKAYATLNFSSGKACR